MVLEHMRSVRDGDRAFSAKKLALEQQDSCRSRPWARLPLGEILDRLNPNHMQR